MALSHEGKIIVFGGYGGDPYHNNKLWSTVDGDNWLVVDSDVDFGSRSSTSALSAGGKIWVFGGANNQLKKNDIWTSLDGASWNAVTLASDWNERYMHRVLYFKNKF